MKPHESLRKPRAPIYMYAQLLGFEIPHTNGKHASVYAREYLCAREWRELANHILEMSQEKFNLKFFHCSKNSNNNIVPKWDQ